MSVIQNQLFSDGNTLIFQTLESQRFCRRCCRSCRHVFGWFDCDAAQLTVRAEIGSAVTPTQRLLPRAVGGLCRIPARSADELDKRRILTFGRIFSPTGSGAYPGGPRATAGSRRDCLAPGGDPPKI